MDLKRGILGAVMGGVTGLQAGKIAEFDSEKESILAAMQVLRDENLARFKHGLDLDTLKKSHGYNVELETEKSKNRIKEEEAKPKEEAKAPTSRKIDRGSEEITQEWNGKEWVDVARSPKWQPTVAGGTDGKGGGTGGGKAASKAMDSLDAQRISGIGNEIEANYIKKNKPVPEWLLNDFNAIREVYGLPTVNQSTVERLFLPNKTKLNMEDGNKPSGLLNINDAISQAKAGGKTNLSDVIAQVKKERGETQEKPKEKPAAEKKPGNDAWAMSAASMNSRQAKKALDQKIQQLKAEAAQAEKDEAALPRAVAARRRVARAKEIRRLTEEANKL
ncbi:MAG: hypothetical protein PHW59_12900 [Desulfobacterales bacterium]|nr:hypothetical protein [Desulfobacterales bacterium]